MAVAGSLSTVDGRSCALELMEKIQVAAIASVIKVFFIICKINLILNL